MIAGVRVDRLEIKRDERGWLTEVLRSSNQLGGAKMAQFYVTVGNPGKTKGKHYHTRKFEWFSVVSGNAKLFLKDIRTYVEFAKRILKFGKRIGWEPKAAVFNELDPTRLTEKAFRLRHEAQGRSRLAYKHASLFSVVPNLMRSICGFA
jgi:hypothetical protein